ncbi:MAG: DUF4389 domain-containing protein [Acidimicrobiia bacterium]|nr:DUF4389 domain-containing protein [Acidimicrobiia bacterium]
MPIERYPARFELDAPLEVANWRPLVHWLLAIPHIIVLYALGVVSGVLAFLSFFTVLFTKEIPDGFVRTQAMVLRYELRVQTYVMFMREDYPPFSFSTVAHDDGIDQTRMSLDSPGELNRWLPLVKWLLIIPHLFVLFFVAIGAAVVHLISFFAVLFTGRYPAGMREFVLGFLRWALRVNVYVMFLTDDYPPFSLEQSPPPGGATPGSAAPPPPPPPPVG